MDDQMKEAIKEYGRLIKRKGHAAGEVLIAKYRQRFKDFDTWAMALAVMLRADELLGERETEEK